MTITIPVTAAKAARKLLTRIRTGRFTLPVLTHILATIDKAGLTLAVTDLDHWLETRVHVTIDPFAPGRFLIPAEALKAATQGDRNSSARFACETTDGTTLTLTAICVDTRNGKRWVALTLLDNVRRVSAGNVTIPANHEIPKCGDVWRYATCTR
jgi:hypothetical protein